MERDENGDSIPATDEDGDPIQGSIKIKDSELFNKEMYEIMSLECEVGYDKINFEDLNLNTIKVKDLMQIEFLFK